MPGSHDSFAEYCAPSSIFVTMAVFPPIVETEDCYCEALYFSQHRINLELYEENMEPEKATVARRNIRINPSTMTLKKLYQRQDRVSDKKSLTATDRPSYQARQLLEDEKSGCYETR